MNNYIVILVVCVLAIVVFTEIIFINKKGQAPVLVQHDSMPYYRPDKINYTDTTSQSDDLVLLVEESENALILITEDQLPAYPFNITATDGNWQNVNGTRFKFYVFSAFVDRRKEQKLVRIIAVTKTRAPEKVWCRLWYDSTDLDSTTYLSKTVAAEVQVIRENHGKEYSASFVLCPLQANQTIPTAVSVVAKVLESPTNLLIINDNYNDTVPNNKLGICMEPMYNGYNGTMRILEFLELNRILGVSHITFYNYSIRPEVDCILKDYIARGLITILPWKLNMTSQNEIWTKGIFAALNDCLYRSMYQFSHIAVIDIDEYIISRRNNSLPMLMDYLETTRKTKKIGSYNFRNAFFYLPWGDDEWVNNSNNLIATNLFTLRKTRRTARLYPYLIRSKYIYRPEVVVEVGNHFVWKFIPGYHAYDVPIDTAILYHYRERCEHGNRDCLRKESIIDTTVLRYQNSLVRAVTKQYLRLKHKCDLEDLHFPIKQKS